MLDASRLHGVLPAIPTPVHGDDTIDVDATRALVRYLVDKGVDGIVPLGGTGEYGSLSRAERVRMAGVVVETVAGRVPVVAGILDPGFHDALEAGRAFADAGVDALMVVTPYYTNPTQAGIRDYFLRYADTAPLPILIYEIPYRTRIAVDPDIMAVLSRHERIVGMKACNPDFYHFLRVVAAVDPSFAILSGEDTLFPLHVAAGAKGGIVVTASLLPTAWRRIFDHASNERLGDALALHRGLMPLMDMAFSETNPGPMKAVTDLIGVDAPALLAPLVPPSADLAARLRAELTRQLAAFEAGS